MTASLSSFRIPAATGVLLLASFVVAGPPLRSRQDQATPASPELPSTTLDLPGTVLWQDTGLDLQAGDSVRVIANGELHYKDSRRPSGPDGFPSTVRDFVRFLPIAGAGRGALIARIGSSPADVPFFVGTSSRFDARTSGRLFIGINQMLGDTGEGAYHVTIRVLSHSSAPPPQPRSSQDDSEAFSAVFCTVLEREHPDAGPWGPCSQYIEDPADGRVPLRSIPRAYHVAIVSGVMSVCGGDSTAFREGREHLRAAHGISVDLIPAPEGSSEANGKDIAKFLKESYRRDGRKFILLGYSKGAPDILQGVADDPDAQAAVAALITVAGAIGGSPIADVMPAKAQQWIQAISMGQCKGDLYSAFRSLRRDVRRKFLSEHPDPGFPVYSISAVSSKAQTSKVLLEGWMLLSIYGQPEDSQLLESDTQFPGGHILGAVHADHMAVAIPYENSTDPEIKKLVNHNHFPRTTLLESLLRFVTADLALSPHAAP